MEVMQTHKKLWLKEDEVTGKVVVSKVPFSLSKEEKKQFYRIPMDLKLPSKFSSNSSNNVTVEPPSLKSMKSHDYHVIMEYLLSVLVQHAFPKHKELIAARTSLIKAMCILEKYFPPSFFDINIHLMLHLADKALHFGLVRFRWMYPFERLMQRYKDKSGNKIYVEGSIAEAYIIDESILWCIEYMENPALGTHKGTHETFIDEEDEYADEGPLLYGKEITLTHLQFAQVRKWVLKHYDEADEYRKVETQLDGFQNELTDVNQALNILVQAHLGKTQNISKSVNKGGSNSSSSVANTPQQENLALCKLLDFDGNEVVHGRVVTDSSSRMCHFRVLQAHEANVLLEEVMIGEACLYKAPQNEKMTIQEIEIGSYLVWNKHLLKFD